MLVHHDYLLLRSLSILLQLLTLSNRKIDPNEIHPKTKPLPKNIVFFARLVIRLFSENRQRKRIFKLRKKVQARRTSPAWFRSLLKLDEQRRNLVALADYNQKIVVPSFLFLALGALTMSNISSLLRSMYTVSSDS